MQDILAQCRALLEDLTPLYSDCGAVCGGACCESHAGEETGMLLFPGEEAYYNDLAGYRVLDAAQGKLLICPGRCDRAQRPLSCRMFPLLPLLREDGVKVGMDARSKAVCPLCRGGVRGMRAEFVEAVRVCGLLLAQDDAQRGFLERLTREHDELKALQRQFGGR